MKTIKVAIEVTYELDGNKPSREDIIAIVNERVAGVMMSEEVGKPELWALVPKTMEVRIDECGA